MGVSQQTAFQFRLHLLLNNSICHIRYNHYQEYHQHNNYTHRCRERYHSHCHLRSQHRTDSVGGLTVFIRDVVMPAFGDVRPGFEHGTGHDDEIRPSPHIRPPAFSKLH